MPNIQSKLIYRCPIKICYQDQDKKCHLASPKCPFILSFFLLISSSLISSSHIYQRNSLCLKIETSRPVCIWKKLEVFIKNILGIININGAQTEHIWLPNDEYLTYSCNITYAWLTFRYDNVNWCAIFINEFKCDWRVQFWRWTVRGKGDTGHKLYLYLEWEHRPFFFLWH